MSARSLVRCGCRAVAALQPDLTLNSDNKIVSAQPFVLGRAFEMNSTARSSFPFNNSEYNASAIISPPTFYVLTWNNSGARSLFSLQFYMSSELLLLPSFFYLHQRLPLSYSQRPSRVGHSCRIFQLLFFAFNLFSFPSNLLRMHIG